MTREMIEGGWSDAHDPESNQDVELQDEGANSFVKSWNELLARIAQKTATSGKAP